MAKATVVRKSLGPKRPCGFDSRPGHEGKPGFIAWLSCCLGRQQGFGSRSFAICCYSNSYESPGSQPALCDGGWEPPVLQVNDNQPRTHKADPNLSTPISGRARLPIIFTECGHPPKKTPNGQTPILHTRKTVLFRPQILWKSVLFMFDFSWKSATMEDSM